MVPLSELVIYAVTGIFIDLKTQVQKKNNKKGFPSTRKGLKIQ